MLRPLQFLTLLLAHGLAMLEVPAQTGKVAARIDAEQRHDPYTHNAPAALARLGYESLGPFSWGRQYGTDHIARTLGARRMLWVETAHFKLGCDLAPRVIDGETRLRRQVSDELTELAKKLPGVKPRNRKLDRWLLLHLYAHRLEKLYTEFMSRLGVDDIDFPSNDGRRTPGKFMGNGPYLGQRGKFCVVLFDQPEQLKRYLKAFAKVDAREVTPRRHYLTDSGSMVFATASGCFMGQLFSEVAMHNHVVGEVIKNLAEGYKSRLVELPPWLLEGLGHWFRRRVSPRINLIDPDADPAEAAVGAWDWAPRVRARVRHDYFPRASRLMAEKDHSTWREQSHMMSWSRVDFLIHRSDSGLRQFLDALKDQPIPWKRLSKEKARAWQAAALDKAWGLSMESFDSEWRKFVLSVYPK